MRRDRLRGDSSRRWRGWLSDAAAYGNATEWPGKHALCFDVKMEAKESVSQDHRLAGRPKAALGLPAGSR